MRRVVVVSLFACALASCAAEVPSDARWPDRSAPIGGTRPLGYVTNDGDDTVSVIALASLSEVARRPVGLSPVDPEAPHHLAVDPALGFVWVGLANNAIAPGGGLHGSHGSGMLPSYVERLRLDDLSPDGEAPVDPNLGDIVLAGEGRLVTTHFDLAQALAVVASGGPVEDGYGALELVDGTTMTVLARTPVCTAPHGAAVTRDGARALLACYGDDAVALVDLSTTPPTVLARIPVGPAPLGNASAPRYGPYAVAFSPDESFALVGCLDGQAVRRIDLATRAEVTDHAAVLDGKAYFGDFDPAAARYWVATQGRDSVVRIDVATGAVAARHGFTEAECLAPHEARYVASLDRVFVVCEGDHTAPGAIVSVDPTTLDVIDRLELGVYPDVLRIVEGP